jgi:hypothetical protein
MIYSNITYKTIGFLAICLIATLVSCDKGVEPTVNNTISFGFSGETRAGEGDNLATFWGYNSTNWVYSGAYTAAGLTASNGFEANLSTGNVVPTNETFKDHMEENPEYWTADNYYFYSLWPAIDEAKVYRTLQDAEDAGHDGPGIYFSRTTRVEPNDQLFAYVGFSASDAASKTTPVDFEYQHIYSKIVFNVRKHTGNEIETVVLDSLSLDGVRLGGQFQCGNDGVFRCTPTSSPTSLVLYASTGAGQGQELETEGIPADNIIDGRLMLPQTIGRNQIKVKLVYRFIDANKVVTNTKRVMASLPINAIPEWKSNMVYTYNLYLEAESNNILFGAPEIDTWNTKQGGATIIIQ